MTDLRHIEPMPREEIAKLKAAIEKRWNEKPWYKGGDDPMGSPGCMLRAQEVLALIAAAEANAAPAPRAGGAGVTGRIQLVTAGSDETDILVNMVIDGKTLAFAMTRGVAASAIARIAAALAKNSG